MFWQNIQIYNDSRWNLVNKLFSYLKPETRKPMNSHKAYELVTRPMNSHKVYE